MAVWINGGWKRGIKSRVHVFGVIWLSGWFADLLWCTVHDMDLEVQPLIKAPAAPSTRPGPRGRSSTRAAAPLLSQVEWGDWRRLEVKPEIFAWLPTLHSPQLAAEAPLPAAGPDRGLGQWWHSCAWRGLTHPSFGWRCTVTWPWPSPTRIASGWDVRFSQNGKSWGFPKVGTKKWCLIYTQ